MKGKVIISLPHLKHGGSERAASELANFFVSQGIETVVLLMYKKAKSYSLGDKVKLVEPSGYWTNLPKFLYPFFLIFYLRKNIKKESPHSVLAFGYKTFIFFACLKLNVRLIDSLRTSPSRIRFPQNKFYDVLYNFVRGLLNKRVDGVIAQTDRAKNVLSREYKCEIKVIPNSVREIVDYQVPKENIILSVGRLSKEKGHQYLLKAFAKLNTTDWKLYFLGDGPQRNNLELLSKKLKIEKHVKFEGFQPDVDLYMQRSKIFVLPSLIEGFPNALVEAMANGLACISFDCDSGPSEIIRDEKNGILVEVGNIQMLSQRLKELIENRKLRDSLATEAKEVIKIYDMVKVGQEYIHFLLPENLKHIEEREHEDSYKYRQYV